MRPAEPMKTGAVRFSGSSCAEIRLLGGWKECAERTAGYLAAGNIALSGGTTYSSLYPYWLSLGPDCSGASFYPVDERAVAFESEESNWGTAFREFLLPLGKAADRGHFASSARAYREILERHFAPPVPVFDTVFLGVGADGHTAGLFPGGPCLHDTESWVLETESPRPPFRRITLGPAVLAAARTAIIIVAGPGKHTAARAILEKDPRLPIVRVLSSRSRSLLFMEKNLIEG
jgi:6-phosphogluconolactonase